MRTNLRITTTLVIMFISLSGFGQSKEVNQGYEVNVEVQAPSIQRQLTLREKFQEIEGTYEVIISQPDYNLIRTESLYNTIQSSRQPDQNVTVNWDQYTSIVVYSTGIVYQTETE